jgi:DNA-binding IclR family transcriptional regulator
MKHITTESTIEEFCERQELKPSELASLAGVHKMSIHNYSTVLKSNHIVRHDQKTGDFQIVRTEIVMCSGNVKTTKGGK